MEENSKKIFTQNIDYLWRTVAVYTVILIVYSVLIGSIEKGYLTLKLFDPIVILLLIIILYSLIALVSRYYRQKTIIIDDNSITIKTVLGEKNIFKDEIEAIIFTKEKFYRSKRKYSVIKIKLKNRKKTIRIRPSAFNDEKMLTDSLIQFNLVL
jgi:hypothetical protein